MKTFNAWLYRNGDNQCVSQHPNITQYKPKWMPHSSSWKTSKAYLNTKLYKHLDSMIGSGELKRVKITIEILED